MEQKQEYKDLDSRIQHPQVIEDDMKVRSSCIPQHLSQIDNMLKFSKDIECKLLSSGKFKKDEKFKLSISAQVIEINFECLKVMLHYGYFKMEVAIIYTQIDEKVLEDLSSKSGSFGVVKFVEYEDRRYAVKGVRFEQKDGQIDLINIYKEYFLCSLADVLQVGPKVHPLFGYDLLLTKNVAFFAMEECNLIKTQFLQMVQKQLLENLRTMHAIRLMHMDIKPGNAAYSNFFQKYIFIDFGLSKLIKQPPGQKTKTRFAGTLSYCSEEMKNCCFLDGSKYVDLYQNDLHCLQKMIRVLHRDLGGCGLETEIVGHYSPFSEIVSLLRLKYYIQAQNIKKIIYIIKCLTNIQRTVYEIFQGCQIPKSILESQQIKQRLKFIKASISDQGYQVDPLDRMLCEFFCLEKRTMSAQKIIPISQILQSESEIFNRYLVETELLMKLFHFLQPFSKNSYDTVEDKYEIKKTAILRIYALKNPTTKEPIFFCEKVRFVLIYFYQKLKIVKNLKVLLNLRMLFISIQDWTYARVLQLEIAEIIEQPFLKMLKIAEFICFNDTLFQTTKKEAKKIWAPIIHKIQLSFDDLRAFKIKSFLDIVMQREDYMNFGNQFTIATFNLIEAISGQCCSVDEMESIYNIKHIFIEFTRLGKVINSAEAPKGLAFEIYSRFFSTIKVNLTSIQQKQSQLFYSIRS